MELFTPEGRLNDRHRVEAVVRAAMPHLAGPHWAKTRRLLSWPESFTFLDQAARRLAASGLEEDVLSVLVELEGLRRQPWRRSGSTPAAAAARGSVLARTLQCDFQIPKSRTRTAAKTASR